MSRPHVVILGLMGAGKSTLAAQLARYLERPWRDSDADIEARTQRSGREIAADPTQGVDTLHALEEVVLLDTLASDTPSVISAAGWVVESSTCQTAMRRRATVLWLHAPADVLRERMNSGVHRRTMAQGELEALTARRAPLFEHVADAILDQATVLHHALVAISLGGNDSFALNRSTGFSPRRSC
jgi:shikimate kinase